MPSEKKPIDEMDAIRVGLVVRTGRNKSKVVDEEQTAANRQAAAKCAEAFDEPMASKAALAALLWAAEHKPGYDALVRERDELKGRMREHEAMVREHYKLKGKWEALRQLLFSD